MEIQHTNRPFFGYSKEPKEIVHICVVSRIQTRIHRIGFILSNATRLLPPLIHNSNVFFFEKTQFECYIFFGKTSFSVNKTLNFFKKMMKRIFFFLVIDKL